MEDEDLFNDADMFLISTTIEYRMKWLRKYIDKHDIFGGAEEAKVTLNKLRDLRNKIRHAEGT
jgi:hypothetical protein